MARTMRRTEGAVLLQKAVDEGLCGPTIREFAENMGASAVTFYTWRIGTRIPGATFREILSRKLDIPRSAWLTEDERKRLAKAAA